MTRPLEPPLGTADPRPDRPRRALVLAIPAVASATISYVVNSTGDAPDKAPGPVAAKPPSPANAPCARRSRSRTRRPAPPTGSNFSAAFDGQAAGHDRARLGAAETHRPGPHRRQRQHPCATADDGIEGPCVGLDADGGDGLVVECRRHRDRRPGDRRRGRGNQRRRAPAKASPSATPGSGSSSTAPPARRRPGSRSAPTPTPPASAGRRRWPATCSPTAVEGSEGPRGRSHPGRRQLLRRRSRTGPRRRPTARTSRSPTQAAGFDRGREPRSALNSSPSETASSACDGACNVISGATTGIDLAGRRDRREP